MRYLVVLDTNVLFSAAGWEGKPRTCVSLVESGRVVGITCQEILDELESKLIEKNVLTILQTREYIKYLESFLQKFEIRLRLPTVVSDPIDQRIIECAVEANATHILTYRRPQTSPAS